MEYFLFYSGGILLGFLSSKTVPSRSKALLTLFMLVPYIATYLLIEFFWTGPYIGGAPFLELFYVFGAYPTSMITLVTHLTLKKKNTK